MAILRPEPDLLDIAGWRQLVEDLRATAQDQTDADFLAYAEAHLAAISAPPEKTAAEAA